jgi:hypothetical protein
MLISASDNSLLIYSSALIWFFKKNLKKYMYLWKGYKMTWGNKWLEKTLNLMNKYACFLVLSLLMLLKFIYLLS